ncbi:amyloid beta precursor protein binding protein 1 [Geosmithia morbida]|uniref:NEDD8-activating enzyme E1 regulatory subunit n=1 Tax=Geosmithia morbida TaxID=1094350 RepID=A0A9P4Z0U6_9HYPO|nr:amyloid beta precursor protein binding protein 1 [Geosmithia morbida]KAF4125351.1 amyloid beta precursor protein binding protein 1 [Geosmithia morbida]
MSEAMAQMPPALYGPTEKERKYDRQLRLWAASGQSALESANILLVNTGCGTVGVEALKNLVLPGIGSFTIADESSDNSTFEQLLQTSELFSLILVTMPIDASRFQLLESYASKHNVPLVVVHSSGFYSYFRLVLPSAFPIVDTHPDETATADLRLLSPWPELTKFAKDMAKDIDSLDDHEHGHLPLVVILLHYLEWWKDSHDGAYPVAYHDKTAFRDIVSKSMRRDNPEGGEENFEEAVAAVMKHVVEPLVPSTLKQLFDYQDQDTESTKSSFWIITGAVKKFYEAHGVLPLPGSLPDMKAQSHVYIQLQNIYKNKARQDASEVLSTVRNTPGGADVDPQEVELFCTNARFIKLINSPNDKARTLAQITEQELGNDEIASISGPEMPLSLVPIYLALSATAHADEAPTAEAIMVSITQRVPEAANKERIVKAAQEVSRTFGNELHNVSAAIGGMVAQEMIKIITKQYIPIDNTCIYDGIVSRCQVLRL